MNSQVQNTPKGFRAIKQQSKAQIEKQNDKLKEDLQKLFGLSKIILERQNKSDSELKDWLLTVDFKISAMLHLLVSDNVFSEDIYKTTYEDIRVKYLITQEFQDDISLNRSNSSEPAKIGDTVILSVEAFDSDNVFSLDFSTRYSASELGSGLLLKEIDEAVVGMVAGESKDGIMIEINNQKYRYKVTLLRVKKYL